MVKGDIAIMYAELRTIHDTMKSIMGELVPEIDWD